MSKRVHFHCLSCGENFYADLLSEEEQREHVRENRPFGPTRCPKCGGIRLERG